MGHHRGGLGGTGRSLARRIAASGIRCILIARRREPLEILAQEILAESGVACITASIDLSTTEAANEIIAVAGAREIGLYVSNAGGGDTDGTRFLDVPLAHWMGLAHINALTAMACCHHFAGPMRTRRRGGLLLVNSAAAYNGSSFMAVYSASKAFLLNLGESLWADLRLHNVDVLNLMLTQTDTPSFRRLLSRKGLPPPSQWASTDEVADAALSRLPHGPIYNWGQDDDVTGYAPTSASARRTRLLAVEEMSKKMIGD